jgi:hypothetical protein
MRVMPDGHGQAVTCTYCVGGMAALNIAVDHERDHGEHADGCTVCESLRERVERLEEALRFYADGRHWNGALLGRVDDYDDERDALLAPVPGARARAALVQR